MTARPPFRYESFETDPERGLLTCRYSVGGRQFAERVSIEAPGGPGAWADPAVTEAARLVFLLAGVSYYKTAAPPVIDLGATAVTDAERAFLRAFYLDGLGEFAYRNELDLSGLQITGPRRDDPAPGAPGGASGSGWRAARPARPLVPFGGGIDSIVTVEHVRHRADATLFVIEPARRPVRGHRGTGRRHRAAHRPGGPGDRPAAAALARAGLPERPRPGDRDPVGDRGTGRRPGRPRRRGHVQRVVGFHPDAGGRRTAGQPPVLQERDLRGRLPVGAGRRARRPGQLLLRPAPLHRAVGSPAVRRADAVPRHVPQL